MAVAATFPSDTIANQMREALSGVPLIPVLLVNFTMPVWRDWLSLASDALAISAQVLAVMLALYKLYEALAAGRDGRGEAAKSFADVASLAAKKGATTSGAAFLGGLAILGVIGALAAGAKRDQPAPLAIMSNPAAVSGKSRKRSKDDAGEDGETEAGSAEGPAWFRELHGLIGTHEGTARKPNPAVQKMFKDAGFPNIKDTTGVAWCAAGLNAVLERSGNPGSKSLAARSFLNWGEPCEPKLGCIVVIWRVSKNGWQGHCFLYAGETETHIKGLGCNQSDSVTVALFPKSRVLGYRWPRQVSTLKTAVAAKLSAASSTASAITQGAKELEELKEPLQQAGLHQWAGYLALALALVSVAAALYANRQRVRDFYSRGQ